MKRPKLIVIAGPNGSGKTTVTHQILKHEWVEECEYINPDFIARDKFGDWNSPEMVLKAAQYAEKQREYCLKNHQSLIFETVLSAKDKIEFILRAKQQNYFIRLFFICTDNPEINTSRVAKRVMQGGHDVPINKIISRYYKSIANCSFLAKIVDRLYIYENSRENELPVLLFRTKEGKLIKQYNNVNEWAKMIYEEILI
ncbi:MAG: zeta toxin family protein [Marinilabiliaceae bacterium]|nr:zeta toxin family protein [Marinilabiliaceae bacterium]